MKHLALLVLAAALLACNNPMKIKKDLPDKNDWEARKATLNKNDSLLNGSTYLPVYSEIYQRNQNYTFDLTATVSMRNISLKDTLYIHSAAYYGTNGNLIRNYFENTVYVLPMETIEIIVNEDDKTGGSGANFVFEWSTKQKGLPPFFEAVMISTSGQQGISFTTQGIRKK